MSVPQKSIPSAVVYYYCAWYTFLRIQIILAVQNLLVSQIVTLFKESLGLTTK